MNFNTILYRFGLNPDNFINEDREPIRTEDGFIYEIRQRVDIRICPECGSDKAHVHDHDIVEINCCQTDHIKDILRIIKTRFMCNNCRITYTPKIDGIDTNSSISNQTKSFIINDFTKVMSFADIGRRYGISSMRVIQIFDDEIPFIPRGRLPEVLCIDEKGFNGDTVAPYCCILYDHQRREVVDIIESRQLPYLYEYFSNIPESELNNVKYFVSDMYDGYRNIYRYFFKKAIHIIDLFHVVQLLTRAVNKIRYNHVKTATKSSPRINFMKSKWKLFLCRRENIPDKWYTPKGWGKSIHYTDMVFDCAKQYDDLLVSYNILQDLYHYNRNDTFMESLKFIDNISERLKLTGIKELETVGTTYTKFRVEIANGLAKNQTGKYYSNSIAESINNNISTIVKVSYGYGNFKRYRKRIMLISRYKKI